MGLGDGGALRAAPEDDDASAQALDAANGFHAAFPALSAKRVFTWTQVLALLCLGFGGYAAFRFHPTTAALVLHVAGSLLFTIAIATRLVAAAHLQPILSPLYAPAPGQAWPHFTILCPLRGEERVVSDLVASLSRLDYPADALQILLLVEADDLATIEAARAAATHRPFEVVIVPVTKPRTKPKALNYGLAQARGEFVVVYDAEDRPHPLQLRAAAAAFANGGATLACVQAPLAIDNAGESWIASQFAAEYAIQFRELLPILAAMRLPIPLGGASNHFRAETLRACGGWDAYNVTEDADLGYRLARRRLRIGMIAPPTWEEAPVTLDAWSRQRTRWIKGHIQTWLVLMRNPWRTAREMGPAGFASMQIILGGGVAASLLHGPLAALLVLNVVLSLHWLSTADVMLAVCGYVIAIFAALTAGALSGELRHMRAALTMPFYWPLSSVAAFYAIVELFIRPHHWTKTSHGVSKGRPSMPAPSRAPTATLVAD